MIHHHQCPNCKALWAHDEDHIAPWDWQREHTCQHCGQPRCVDKCDERGKLYRCYSDAEFRQEIARRKAEYYGGFA